MAEERVRLFVGGLGAAIQASDLERAFGSLGAVRSVEMIRSNDRDFAYIDFEASSPAALRKVFSTYKGCKWKGGCLRVEIAKEHYLARLERERAEARAQEQEREKKKQQKDGVKITKKELRIFFPQSRKVKVVSGGQHKRSFERSGSPPLALLNLCSCGGHEDDASVDPFDYEHDNYLRLVEKLEGKHSGTGPSVSNSKVAAGVIKSKEEVASKRKSKATKRDEVVSKEDVLLPAIIKRSKKEKKMRIFEKKNGEAERSNEFDEVDNAGDDGGVFLPGIRRSRGLGEASGNEWHKTFEAAAGLQLRDDFSEDISQDYNAKENSTDDVAIHEQGQEADNVRQEGEVSLLRSERKKKLDQHESDEADFEEFGAEETIQEQEEPRTKTSKRDKNAFGSTAITAAKTDDLKLASNKRKSEGLYSEKKKVARLVDENKKHKEQASGAKRLAGDNEVENKQQQQKQNDTSWVRFSYWKSLVGEGNNATFSLSAMTGTKADDQQQGKNAAATNQDGAVPVSDVKAESTSKSERALHKVAADKVSRTKKEPPSIKSLLEKKTCSFMRSSAAEEQWLSSKEKLHLDYKAKHKAAMRTKRKSF